MNLIIFLVALFAVAYFLDRVNEAYAGSKRYKSIKETIKGVLSFFIMIPLGGFVIAMVITDKLGMETGGFKQGLVMLISGIGFPLAMLWIIYSLN